VNLPRGPGLPIEPVIIPSFPQVPQSEKSFVKIVVSGGSRKNQLEDNLNSIIFVGELICSKRWVSRKPDRSWKMTMEKKMGIIFNGTINRAEFIDVSIVPCSHVTCS
jgi:hypothetical protein